MIFRRQMAETHEWPGCSAILRENFPEFTSLFQIIAIGGIPKSLKDGHAF
jgi:hypothetical protein